VAWRPSVIIISAVPMVQAVLPYLPSELRRISVLHSIMEVEIRFALGHGRWLDWVVAVSDNAHEKLEQASTEGTKLATIPVGLEIPQNQRNQDKAENPLRLMYLGRISPEKNPQGLLRVLSALHDACVPFRATIAGDGPALPALRRQVQNSPFAAQISLLGAQSPVQVECLLDAHDFLLLTSHFEGTPHAVLEAMAHGLVVVASRLPGSTDRIINHGVDGYLCDRERPSEYVSVLKGFIDQPQSFGSLSRAASHTAASRYSATVLAARYESLFAAPRRTSIALPKQLRDGIIVPQSLRPRFHGIILHARHRIADFGRLVTLRPRQVPWSH
jgi:glycosyltransferase involved in cell wall biosynthesis